METTIYIKLLNENVDVWAPAPASIVDSNVYKIEDNHIDDKNDEVWEFKPGSLVVVEERIFQGNKEKSLVAVKEYNK